MDPEAPGARNRGRGEGEGPREARGRWVGRVSKPTRSPDLKGVESPGPRERGARRKSREERALQSWGGLRAGCRTHRAGGGSGGLGAGRVLPPQAGLEALHGQVKAVPLPGSAARRAPQTNLKVFEKLVPAEEQASRPHLPPGGPPAPRQPRAPGRSGARVPTANPPAALGG